MDQLAYLIGHLFLVQENPGLNLDRKQIIFFEAHGQQIGFITLQDL
jgi:hypothetical protein